MKKISGTFLLHIATAFTTQERSRTPVFHYILLQHLTLDTAPLTPTARYRSSQKL
jgi:hypothetical protein